MNKKKSFEVPDICGKGGNKDGNQNTHKITLNLRVQKKKKKRKNKKIKNLSPPALISFEQDVIPHDLTVLDSIIYHRFKGSTVEEIEIAIAIGQFIIEVAIVFIDCTSSIRNREGIST